MKPQCYRPKCSVTACALVECYSFHCFLCIFKITGDRYLLDSGRYNWLWFLCCLGIVMNNLLQSYGIDGHSLLG